ncbi:hypothetical protein [Streptomyces sp. NPDC058279]|uniref:hypothetical protein n=1 Tax=Streptomyces sp. NPDC058279 TaxID=3346418 RepID=UPI0036EA6716
MARLVLRLRRAGHRPLPPFTLIAVVALAFTGTYPRDLLNLVVGRNCWVLHVIAYAALMTDEYPPLRLDLGGEEPITPGIAR